MSVMGLGSALDQAQLSCVAAGAGSSYLVTGEIRTTKLTGQESGGSCGVSELTVLPGGGPPLHRHMQHETLFVLEGELQVTGVQNGRFVTYKASRGSTFHVPGCVPHSFHNATAAPVRVLSFNGPAGLESFYTVAGDPVNVQSPPGTDLEQQRNRYLDLALDHGIEPIDPELFDQREGYRATGVHFYEPNPQRALAMPSMMVRFLARNEHTDSQLTILELTQLAGGGSATISHHQSAVFYTLEGTTKFATNRNGEQREWSAERGCTVLIPRNTQYSFSNLNSSPSRLLAFYTPAGIEDFMMAVSQPVNPEEFLASGGSSLSDAELEQLSELGIRYGVYVETSSEAL